MMTACPKPKKTVTPTWSDEIIDEMNLYMGTVLPYVELNADTLYHAYDSSYETSGFGMYVIGDDNETNLIENYGDALVEAGWTFKQGDEGDYYALEVNDFELTCTFNYYEATDEYSAGNEIAVACPIYVQPVTEESLLENGYVKVNGWPASGVLEVLTDAYNIGAVNETGEWFVSGPTLIEGMFGDYYAIFLATQSDVVEEFAANLESSGYYYDTDYQAYYSSDDATEIDVGLNNGFTLIDIYGPYLAPEVTSEEEQEDGSIDVSFTFAGALTDGDAFNNAGFESTSASVEFSQGGNGSNAPKYYDNGEAIRCYAKNTVTISAASGLTINSVTIEVGFLKTLKPSDIGVSSGTVSATGTSAPATVTISGVNASTLTITVGPNASGGNIGMSSIKVNVSSAQ